MKVWGNNIFTLLFQVIFKMDFFGNGILIEKSQLNQVLAIQNSFYSFEKFRYMCILSGCDYLPSLPGIGLVKACKVLKTARQQELRLVRDFHKLLHICGSNFFRLDEVPGKNVGIAKLVGCLVFLTSSSTTRLYRAATH